MKKKKQTEQLISKKLIKEVFRIVYKNKIYEDFKIEEAPQFDAKIMLEQKIVRYFE